MWEIKENMAWNKKNTTENKTNYGTVVPQNDFYTHGKKWWIYYTWEQNLL
jgi:hypothetical protein